MKQPWLKFFMGDWRADPRLRMCSLAARGLWFEMLCIMRESDPPGSLTVGDTKLSLRQLASLVGATVDEVTDLAKELEAAGVYSRDDDGTVYSRRMRRDYIKSQADKANGELGGNPKLKKGVNPKDKASVKGGDKAQKPESRSQNNSDPSVPSGSRPSKSKKTRHADAMPLDWTPSIDLVNYGIALGLTEGATRFDLEQFRIWALNAAGREVGRKKDWNLAAQGWLRSELKKQNAAAVLGDKRDRGSWGDIREELKNGQRNLSHGESAGSSARAPYLALQQSGGEERDRAEADGREEIRPDFGRFDGSS